MPKPLILDPTTPRKKKKKRRKRKVDYTELLAPPLVPAVQCPHTKRAQDASSCSQCLGVAPSVVHRPVVTDWWAESDVEVELDIEVAELIATILTDDE